MSSHRSWTSGRRRRQGRTEIRRNAWFRPVLELLDFSAAESPTVTRAVRQLSSMSISVQLPVWFQHRLELVAVDRPSYCHLPARRQPFTRFLGQAQNSPVANGDRRSPQNESLIPGCAASQPYSLAVGQASSRSSSTTTRRPGPHHLQRRTLPSSGRSAAPSRGAPSRARSGPSLCPAACRWSRSLAEPTRKIPSRISQALAKRTFPDSRTVVLPHLGHQLQLGRRVRWDVGELCRPWHHEKSGHDSLRRRGRSTGGSKP